jgi:DNA-binding transcriptional regulator YhcF (GntR family)
MPPVQLTCLEGIYSLVQSTTRTGTPMARWEFSLTVDRRQKTPMFVQIVRAIVDDIKRGRLRAGDVLPGTRTLARTLGVQRQTVVAAFNELYAEGWIVTHPARGTFVSPEFPDPSPRTFRRGVTTGLAGPRRVRPASRTAVGASAPYCARLAFFRAVPSGCTPRTGRSDRTSVSPRHSSRWSRASLICGSGRAPTPESRTEIDARVAARSWRRH